MIGFYCPPISKTYRNAPDHAVNVPEHTNDTNMSNSCLIVGRGRVYLTYNSPLLGDASAARAASTSSCYAITKHNAVLTNHHFQCPLITSDLSWRMEFHRSAGTSIPPICARVICCRSDQDGRTQEDRARAPMSSAPLCGDHAANGRDRELSRGTARARPIHDRTSCLLTGEIDKTTAHDTHAAASAIRSREQRDCQSLNAQHCERVTQVRVTVTRQRDYRFRICRGVSAQPPSPCGSYGTHHAASNAKKPPDQPPRR